MTANPTPQPSFSGEHRSPARAALNRWKAGVGLAVMPHPSAETKASAKVSL